MQLCCCRMDVLARIKRCALLHQVRFTEKADEERLSDDLTELEVLESLVNATRIEKTLKSNRPVRRAVADANTCTSSRRRP